jgi:hypothetical protein
VTRSLSPSLFFYSLISRRASFCLNFENSFPTQNPYRNYFLNSFHYVPKVINLLRKEINVGKNLGIKKFLLITISFLMGRERKKKKRKSI